jgi:hypothetical protein
MQSVSTWVYSWVGPQNAAHQYTCYEQELLLYGSACCSKVSTDVFLFRTCYAGKGGA